MKGNKEKNVLAREVVRRREDQERHALSEIQRRDPVTFQFRKMDFALICPCTFTGGSNAHEGPEILVKTLIGLELMKSGGLAPILAGSTHLGYFDIAKRPTLPLESNT